MKVQTQDYKDVTVVQLQGDLDCESDELFDKAVTEIIGKGERNIVLDMSEVGFIDGAGLERMLWARDYCNQNKCQLRLAGLDENCAKILEVTQLEDEFNCYAELAEAVKSFA